MSYTQYRGAVYVPGPIPEILKGDWYSVEAMALAAWAMDLYPTQRSKASRMVAIALKMHKLKKKPGLECQMLHFAVTPQRPGS